MNYLINHKKNNGSNNPQKPPYLMILGSLILVGSLICGNNHIKDYLTTERISDSRIYSTNLDDVTNQKSVVNQFNCPRNKFERRNNIADIIYEDLMRR